jgi:rod shape-determining protein MreD
MSVRDMPFRGSLTSREQLSVYDFSWPALVFIPLVAVLIQIFIPVIIPVRSGFLPVIDLPFLVTIFFATARRNPITGCLTGCFIGLLQDLFAGYWVTHPLGMYGIALTVVGYLASSLGVKIDVENPGSRFLITFFFFGIEEGVYYGVAHGLLRQPLQWSWSHIALSALVNAIIGVFVYRLLDKFKQR